MAGLSNTDIDLALRRILTERQTQTASTGWYLLALYSHVCVVSFWWGSPICFTSWHFRFERYFILLPLERDGHL